MSSYIPREEYEEFIPESQGTVHVNHCKDGRNNARMYVTRNPDGTILVYCHHCGGKARDHVSKLSTTPNFAPPMTRSTPSHKYPPRYPGDTVFSPPEFGEPHLEWLLKSIRLADIVTSRVGYSPGIDALVLPLYNRGKLFGVQYRTFDGERPKYITSLDGGNKRLHVPTTKELTNVRGLVIVEDVLSAYRVSQPSDFMGIALLGTSMDKQQHKDLQDLVNDSSIERIVIWLDNDNGLVLGRALSLYKTLSFTIDKRVLLVTEPNKEPKSLSNQEIEDILKETKST